MRRRPICSSCSNSGNKRLKQKDQTKQGQDANATELPHLPDIIVHKLFQLIPTKMAVRSSIVSKQWQSVFSLGIPFLDLDEIDGLVDHNFIRSRNLMFIDFVESCLRRCETNLGDHLDSFRLRMIYYSDFIDPTRIDKWLSFVVDRCVKELDISIQRAHYHAPYYCIPQTILHAKFLTSLNLENMKMKEIVFPVNLPLLKTLSLKAVLFDGSAASRHRSIWMACPSIEHLSLVSCSCFSREGDMEVSCSGLKSLLLVDCICTGLIIASENLESFTFTSEYSDPIIALYEECVKLKYINIRAQRTRCIHFCRTCRDSVQATIDAPNLKYFKYDGFLLPHDVIIFKACLRKVNLTLDLDYKVGLQSSFLASWPDFAAWRDFLRNFYYCSELVLYIHEDASAEALTFPESLRRVFSPPLFNVKSIWVRIVGLQCPRTVASVSDLMNSLSWMAPYAILRLNYE